MRSNSSPGLRVFTKLVGQYMQRDGRARLGKGGERVVTTQHRLGAARRRVELVVLRSGSTDGMTLVDLSTSSCNGELCTYSSFPAAHDVSVNWSGTLPSGGRATTLGRVFSGDSNHYTDWAVGPGTLGFHNP